MSVEDFVRGKVSVNLASKQKVPAVVSFDPTIILTIIQVIMGFIEGCDLFNKKPEKVKEALGKIGVFERWALRIQTKKAIDDARMFKLYGVQIVNALVESAVEATVDEIKAAQLEVKGEEGFAALED